MVQQYDYSEDVMGTAEDIAELGRDIQLKGISTTLRDSNRPERGADGTTDIATVKAVFVGLSDSDWGQMGISTDFFTVNDKVCMIAADIVTSLNNVKKVIDEGIEYKVNNYRTLKPGGTAVLHFIGLADADPSALGV